MKTPSHVGIILDGNRRWAKEKGLPSYEGHNKGLETAKKIIKYAEKKKVKVLSLFVFSTENWKRSREEVSHLMKLIDRFFENEYQEETKTRIFDKIKVNVIGERKKIFSKTKKIIEELEESTKNHKGMVLNIAFSYGGRMEIVEAIKKIIEKKIPINKIDEKVMRENLSVPDIDLIIRAGKEQRLSNFFIWQAAYSELYFPLKYWPDFSEKDFDEALIEYDRRQRRFGK